MHFYLLFTIYFSIHSNLVFALTLHKTAMAKGILTQFLTNSYECLSFLKLHNSFFWKLFFWVGGIKSKFPVVYSWSDFLFPLFFFFFVSSYFFAPNVDVPPNSYLHRCDFTHIWSCENCVSFLITVYFLKLVLDW